MAVRTRRRLAAAALAAALSIGLASCTSTTGSSGGTQQPLKKEDLVLVASVINTTNPYMASMIEGSKALSEKLGINVGETDPSGMFTLLEFECLGACDRAPIVMVNNEHWHEQATPESCAKLVDDIKARGEAALTGCYLKVER